MVHLLPGQTILELGCGEGLFTQLCAFAREAITAVTFQRDAQVSSDVGEEVELLAISDLPSSLAGQR
jgi:cyclopropane fatty-acyl-phospholipid synthase-like methyltransferase